MKQIFLLLAFLGMASASNAQTTFATADTLSANVLTSGTVNGTSTQHYYKTVLPTHKGVFRLVTSTTNSGSGSGYLQYKLFWKNQNSINSFNVYRTPFASGNDTFNFGALDADSLFLLVDDYYNGQPISYSFKYEMLHAAPSNESTIPNATRATAEALPFNTIKNAYVGFNTPAGVDNEDYFKLVFPRNGTFKLYVTAQSMRDISATVLPQLYIYDRNGGPVSIFRNNNPSGFTYTQLGFGPAYNTITDTFNVYGRAADTMYISLSSYVGNWAATYSLNWSIADTALNNEPAPNETLT
ncbi:MAG: hypothetical protein ABI378_06185, partial [Chitinophagaceae bacterium]